MHVSSPEITPANSIKKTMARLKIRGRCSKKNIKQLNRVSIWVSLGLGLGLVLVLVLRLVLGIVPSSDFCKVPSSHFHVSQNNNLNRKTYVNGFMVILDCHCMNYITTYVTFKTSHLFTYAS